METRELICISCPLGCALTVTTGAEEIEVSGNSCPRGAEYARREILHPRRMVTGSVLVEGGTIPVVSVKTKTEVPKEKIMAVMKEIRRARVLAPVASGEVIIENCAGTGISIVATKNVPELIAGEIYKNS